MPRLSLVFLTALLVGLTACSLPGTSPQSGSSSDLPATDESTEMATDSLPDGPKAAADRTIAPRQVASNASGTATITEVDLGNTEAGAYRAPVRGILVTPTRIQPNTPLIIVNHLRAPNCADGVLAVPCPDGTEGLRLDRGMTYLGEALAEQGYAVLIPDLSGIWVGSDVSRPYDQTAMWTDAVGKLVDGLASDATGTTDIYGNDEVAKIDRNNIGLLVHSRSSAVVTPAIERFGAEAIRGVLAYGPAYETADQTTFSPPPADLPYLALTGEQDLDVGPSANLWLSNYIAQEREHPALVADVPGLGHMLVNRTLAEAGIDDRTACDLVECPDAKVHERLLTTVATQWFASLLNGAPGPIPRNAVDPLPTSLGDLPTRWLAVSPGSTVTRLQPSDFTADAGGQAMVCHHADPMNPEPNSNACPEPELGIVQSASDLNVLTAASASVNASGIKHLNVHLSPSGTYADQAGSGTPVSITLTLAQGDPVVLPLDPTDPALRDRQSKDDNGLYRVGTIRVGVSETVTANTITKVTITSERHPIELRGLDLVP